MSSQVRLVTGVRRIGHAGTLDPLADGVMIVGITREFTKKLMLYKNQPKQYLATVKLGWSSTTDDESGAKTAGGTNPVSLEDVISALTSFVGSISQVPPNYSAIKYQGKRAYRMANDGEKFKLKPRLVDLHEAVVVSYNWPQLVVKLDTGPGFYVRSLARDLGEKLRVGGYLADLTRSAIGQYTLEHCWHLPADAW